MGDEELIDKLKGLGHRLNIVLSNSVVEVDDPNAKPTWKKVKGKTVIVKKKMKVDGNAGSRAIMKKSADVLWNRIMPSNHIGHNKFLVYVDRNSKPVAVLLGSTNWTKTGLCAQTNNTIVIDDAKLATRYLAYWKQLAADTKN